MPELSIKNVTKRFGDSIAVDDLSLDVSKGSLVALLGPSGCGKTTTLRMLAGFIEPTAGSVEIRGESVKGVPPHKRNTAMVFQQYALFPHMTVSGNLSYGLKRRGVPRGERKKQVDVMLSLLSLEGLAYRRPDALSGGQQQRVAVGRALILNPAVLLLDEPFSALDAQRRVATRAELRRLQQQLGTTAVFVTHDQEEAMSISDRVAVMNNGRMEQLGSPEQVYENPATRFVASFIGAANLVEGKVLRRNSTEVVIESDGFASGIAGIAHAPLEIGQSVVAVVRPEDIQVVDDSGSAGVAGIVEMASFLGSVSELRVRTETGTTFVVRGVRTMAMDHPRGSRVTLRWPHTAVRILS